MSNDNKTKFIALSSDHIANLNRMLKNIKSDIMADYAYIDQNSIVIVTFFLYQQFITWDTIADHGSYFITTYIEIETT